MKIRYTFVSNSSSSSFIIPKKYLTEKEFIIYEHYCEQGSPYCDDELHSSRYYIYGKVSIHNCYLTEIFYKYKDLDGVEYEN